jgi:hypothetical protein
MPLIVLFSFVVNAKFISPQIVGVKGISERCTCFWLSFNILFLLGLFRPLKEPLWFSSFSFSFLATSVYQVYRRHNCSHGLEVLLMLGSDRTEWGHLANPQLSWHS